MGISVRNAGCVSVRGRSMSSSPPQWDSQSNLLLLQLIYKYGDAYTSVTPEEKSALFDQIAIQLTNHTLIRPSKRKYTGLVFSLD